MTLQQLRYAVCIAKNHSMNKAASELYITQPSLSETIKDLEKELGFAIFQRSNRGVVITLEGEDFLGYARQMLEQYALLEDRFLNRTKSKKKFSVSMQHYSFAVEAFIDLAKEYGMDEFEFAVNETKTYEVIDNVKIQKSEIGIVYENEFNEKALEKLFREADLEFHELFSCGIYVYLHKSHPLSGKKKISLEELADYPCLAFDQGKQNSFYLAEEVFSTYDYKQLIRANDRATMLNLMVGLHGFTLCSGILCEDLNGSEYDAIPLKTNEKMKIGYVKKKKMPLSELGEKYITILKGYEKMALS